MKAIVSYAPLKDNAMFFVETNATTVEKALDELWRRFNCVTGDREEEDCVRLGIRSMCVGDFIYFYETQQGFRCEPAGWKAVKMELRLGELKPISESN